MKTNIKIIEGKKVLWLNHKTNYPVLAGENTKADLICLLEECHSNMHDIATKILQNRVATPHGIYFRFELINGKQPDAECIYIINASDKNIKIEEV